MNTAVGFSIWLIPQQRDLSSFQKHIDGLAEVLGGPVFRPHVTLLGGLETIEASRLLDLARLLVGDCGILSARAEALELSENFFQSVILRIGSCPEIFALRERLCRSLLIRIPQKAYHPHLSLHYGHAASFPKKRAVRQLNLPLPFAFRLAAIEVVKTEGFCEEWGSLGIFPFGT